MLRSISAALLLLCACAEPARTEPAVWKIEDADSSILMFGSFHLLPEGVDWRPEALDIALVQADDLWFEIPVDNAVNGSVQARLLARASLPPGQSLSALLSDRGRADLVAVARQVNLPLEALDRLRPWYAETILGTAVYRQQGAAPEHGVERQIADTAPTGVERRALESGEQQIELLAQGDIKAQVASLEYSLRQFQSDPAYFHRLMGYWLKGDAAALDREVLGELRRTDPAQYRALIVERNHAWAPLIEARLKGSGHTVIVVGVGHLVGRDGVPALLRAQGIKVEGP